MKKYDLYEMIDKEKCAVYVLSPDGSEITYMNPAASDLTPKTDTGCSFLAAMCGRKKTCLECPLNSEIGEDEVRVGPDALCAFARVGFCRIVTDDGEMILSRWRGEKADMIEESGLFELDDALHNLGDSRDTYDSILRTYYTDSLDKPRIIRSYLSSDNIHDLRIEVHGLKSTSFIVGLNRFGEFSKQMEYACRDIETAKDGEDEEKASKSRAFINENIERYLSELNDILELLRVYFGDEKESGDTGTDNGAPALSGSNAPVVSDNGSDEAVKDALRAAADALDVYDLDGAQLKLTSAAESASPEMKQKIKDVMDRINAFDYSGAGKLLKEI